MQFKAADLRPPPANDPSTAETHPAAPQKRRSPNRQLPVDEAEEPVPSDF